MERLEDKLLTVAKTHANKVVLTCKRNDQWLHWTYQQMLDHMETYRYQLEKVGIVPGDRVAILATNEPETIFALLAVLFHNATAVMLDPNLPDKLLRQLIEFSDVRAIYLLDNTHVIQAKQLLVPCMDLYTGQLHSQSLNQTTGHLPAATDMDEQLACILFTSGTSGTPKGVMLTHSNIITETTINQTLGAMQASDRILAMLPIFHITSPPRAIKNNT